MNVSRFLILAISVTFLGACGSKKGGQPNVKPVRNGGEVTRSNDGKVSFTGAGLCENIQAANETEFCTQVRDRAAQVGPCKDVLLNTFRKECMGVVDSTIIAEDLAKLDVKQNEDGSESAATDASERNFEVTPEILQEAIENAKFSEMVMVEVPVSATGQVQASTSSNSSADTQDYTNSESYDRVQRALGNSTTITDRGTVDELGVTYMLDLSTPEVQTQVATEQVIEVRETTNTETGDRRTRIEELTDDRYQFIGYRDNSLSLEEDAKRICREGFHQLCRKETRGSVVTLSQCKSSYDRDQLDECAASVRTNIRD